MTINYYQRLLVLLVGLGLAPFSMALQEKPVQDNHAVQAFVSLHGLTRIAVDNDRIQDVRGPDGAYQIKADTNQGAVFIQPTPAFEKKPFTLFIATEHQHNYVLRLIPRDQRADTILLKPQGSNNSIAARWETALPYTEVITQLVTAMATQHVPDGYAIDHLTKVKRQQVNAQIAIKPVAIYQGAYLQGVIYQLSNRTAQSLPLKEQTFYQAGDRAIALAQLQIAPHGQTWLFKVRDHG